MMSKLGNTELSSIVTLQTQKNANHVIQSDLLIPELEVTQQPQKVHSESPCKKIIKRTLIWSTLPPVIVKMENKGLENEFSLQRGHLPLP